MRRERGRAAGAVYLLRQLSAVAYHGVADRWRGGRGRSGEQRRFGAGIGDVLRHVSRRLLRRPGTTAAVALVFILGIGVNAGMYHVVDVLLLSPPAHVERPEDLRHVLVHRSNDLNAAPAASSTLSYSACWTSRPPRGAWVMA